MAETQCVDRVVQLVLPPSDHHLRTARLVAADIATRAGLDCDETDDVRIAVDEICHALLRRGRGPLCFSFTGDPDRGVSLTASIQGARGDVADDATAFAIAVLQWVADSFDVRVDGGELRFLLRKRHAQGAGCSR